MIELWHQALPLSTVSMIYTIYNPALSLFCWRSIVWKLKKFVILRFMLPVGAYLQAKHNVMRYHNAVPNLVCKQPPDNTRSTFNKKAWPHFSVRLGKVSLHIPTIISHVKQNTHMNSWHNNKFKSLNEYYKVKNNWNFFGAVLLEL